MHIEITGRFSGKVLFAANADSTRAAVEAGVKLRANLRDANLRNANLEDADLRDANFRNANFRNANLEGADLVGADLRNANLRDANLRNANLEGANFRNANLRNANLEGADLEGADLGGADLGGANLRNANLEGANFRDADLEGAVKAKALLQINPVDGWPVLLWSTSLGLRVRVGCHFFTLAEAEAYWRGKPNRTHLYDLVTEGWKTLICLAGWDEGQ